MSTVAVTAAGSLVGFAAAPAAAAVNPTPAAGARNNATRLPFAISGTASVSVDVGTGNALFTDTLLTLPGVRSDVPVTLSYNSSVFGTSTPSAVTGGTGSGWVISGFDQRMVTNADGSVTYQGPGGLSGVFAKNGSTFTTPAQFRADLTGTQSTGYTLTDHASGEKLRFNSSGRLTTDTDRDGNATTYAYDQSGYPASITASRGVEAGRTATITTSGGQITKITQSTVGSVTRSISLGYSSQGHLTSVTDTTGGTTGFATSGGTQTGQVQVITNPTSETTTLTFAAGKVTQVDQTNPAADGGAGTSSTRLTYPTSTQTLVADPTTNQAQSVSAVPHTTYTISSTTQLVTAATDADGNQKSATYTGNTNVASTTPAAGGATSYTYAKNNGESLTKVATPGGAAGSAQYNNTGSTAYLPSSTTDAAGNSLTSTYDTNGNQTGTAQGATGPTAKVTYNSDGTPATSASPGAATGVTTRYAYANSDANLTTLTPPANSSLGARNYTWDGFGRLSTATDGNGATISYTYDDADRITKVTYSDGTHEVDYTYDPNGHVTQRVDASGTTTYGFDDLGHLVSTSNTANNNTVTSTYDLAGALASSTDARGTVTYGYDAAHELTQMGYPQSGNPQLTVFANNANGKRTDVWLQSNDTHTVWAAHEHFTYDSSGRITGALGQNGPATGPTTVTNQTICYAVGVAPTACTTPAASADRTNIASTYESVSGETNTYTYDDHNRLTKNVVTGGSNPRTYTYGYDAAGNRTSSAVTGANPTSQTLSFNDANQISSTGYTYDGAGNQTHSPTRAATFNAAGQQTSATVGGVTTTYAYAGTNQNELLKESTPGRDSYAYTYGRPDANGLPTIDTVQVGSASGHVFSDPSGQPVMLQTASDVTCLYLYDGTGNPVALSTSFSTTNLALRYDPYGAATRTDPGGGTGSYTENPYEFGQGIQDRATGQLKFGQRWYSPATGTWTQQDALNAPLDPANANRYEYAADNPINILDPTGECLLGDVFGGFFALLAGAAVVATGGLAIAEFGAGELIAGAAAAASGGPPAAGLSLASVFSFQAGC